MQQRVDNNNPDIKRWVAIGIVSVGQQCGDKGRPSVYTDIADYVGWIRSIIDAKS